MYCTLTSKANTMVRALSSDEPHLATLTTCFVVLQGDLKRCVHSSGTTHSKEYIRKVLAWKKLQKLLGKLVG